MTHHPVLLSEVLTGLALRPGAIVVDATVNRGGHASALGERLGAEGILVAIDADAEALAEARENLSSLAGRKVFICGNFRHLGQLLDKVGIGRVDAVLFDLGTSSQQLAEPARGFSFRFSGPLTMTFRSDAEAGALTAGTIVNDWSETELARIIREYGEERFARPIAKALIQSRERGRITSTEALAEVIIAAVPGWYRYRRIHPATKTFQALRIAVNDELVVLTEGLTAAWSRLRENGCLAVITFHSLEARLVKNLFRSWAAVGSGELITRHAVKPTRAEVVAHSQARSAQLRIIKKF